MLKDKKNRLTSQKKEIINYLKGVTTHPSAEIVYSNIKKIIPNISLGTVYRNLGELSDKNTILKLKKDNGIYYYDGNTSFHGHFECNTCDEIIDIFDLDFNNTINNKINNIGQPQKKEVTIYGKCKKCLNN